MSKSNRVRLNWFKYNWEQFENICYAYASEKYDADAYKVTITARRKDGGRDIVIYDKEQKRSSWGECKHHKSSLGLSEIGKNVVLAITNNIYKLIYFSTSSITPNTKCEILKAARIHGFDVLFLDGDKLDEEIVSCKKILLQYFEEDFEKSYQQNDGVFFEVLLDEFPNSYNKSFYGAKQYCRLKNGLVFYIHIFLRNRKLVPIKELRLTLPEDPQYHLSKTELAVSEVRSMSDIVLTVKGVVLNTQRPVKLHMGSVNYYAGDNTYTSQIDFGTVDGTEVWNVPVVGDIAQTFLFKTLPQTEKLLQNDYFRVLYMKGSSGSGKTRLLQESAHQLSLHNISIIYMDAQVYVGVLFQKELIRQLLCLPALDKTEDFSAQILDEILTRSDVHVTNAQQIFDMLFCGKRISLESQIDLFVQCINHPAFQGKYCLQVDNAQSLDVQTQTLLVYLCEKLKNTRANVCMFFSWNTSVPAKQRRNPLQDYLNGHSLLPENTFVIPIVLGLLDQASAQSMVHFCLNLAPSQQAEEIRILQKTGYLPLDIILFCKQLWNTNCFSYDGHYRYIVDVEMFSTELENLTEDESAVLQCRLQYAQSNIKPWRKAEKLFQLLLFFDNHLSSEIVQAFQIPRDLLDTLSRELIIKEDEYGWLSFFHDNYYRFFSRKKDWGLFVKADYLKLRGFTKQMEPLMGMGMRVKYLQCCYMLGEKEPFRIEAKALLNVLMVSENVTEVIALSDFYLRHIQGKEAQNDRLLFSVERAFVLMEFISFSKGLKALKTIYEKIAQDPYRYSLDIVCRFFHHYVNAHSHSCRYVQALDILDAFASLHNLPLFYRFIIADRRCVIYYSIGKFEKANESIDEALTLGQKENNDFWLSTAYSDKAFNYLTNTGDKEKAIYYYQKAIWHYNAKTDNTPYRCIEIGIQKALVELLCGNFKAAIQESDAAISMAFDRSYMYLGIPARNVKACALMSVGDYNASRNLLEQNLFDSEIFGEQKYLIVASNSLGIFYALQGDTNLAHSYFTRALHCIEKISAQGGISRFFAVAMNDLICRKANTVNNDFLNFITSRREQISPQRWNAYQDLLETKQSTMYRSLYTLFTGPYVFMY